MFKRIAVAIFLLALAIPALALSSPSSSDPKPLGIYHHPRPGCHKLFTIKMDQQASSLIYAGTKKVTKRQLRLLARLVHCQRNPQARKYVAWFNHRQSNLHNQRVQAADPRNWPQAVASWYDDGGPTASGAHYTYGFASLIFSFGTRIEFCYPAGTTNARCVVGVDDDHGPYIDGRTFDMNQNIEGILGFDGVGTVSYRVL